MKVLVLVCSLFSGMYNGYGQCFDKGQSPATAFPVCGFGHLPQSVSPSCGTIAVYVPHCSTNARQYYAKDAFYYKFHCYKSGNLNFVIDCQPDDNYDWMLYDVTGVVNLGDIFTDKAVVVSGNWSVVRGPTGMSGQGTTKLQCQAADPGAGMDPNDAGPFAFYRDLYAGHNYILMISHPIENPNGFLLNFLNGTADITTPNEPHLLRADAPCNGGSLNVKLNTDIQCFSLHNAGSDFEIIPPLAKVVKAAGIGCGTYFDFDSVRLTISPALPPGNYFLAAKLGLDGNGLQDDCYREVPYGEKIPFTIYPVTATPMDSLTQLTCATDTLQLVFNKKMSCGSIEKGGSDFKITGPTPVQVIGATGTCDGDKLTKKKKIKLSGPIHGNGTYTITLVKGTDGNTITNECGLATPAGSAISFTVKDTVNADFTYDIKYGCTADTVNYFHNGNNGTDYWRWTFDKLRSSSLQNPVINYTSFGNKNTQLIVSNGVCIDTSVAVVPLNNALHASFEATPVICPGEKAAFKNTSKGGGTITWSWDFDNGNTSTEAQPQPQNYTVGQTARNARARLVAVNIAGCSDTAYQFINVSNSCLISVPNIFTPNGDGINDYLYPLVAYRAKDLSFRVFNRFGQLMFETTDWTKRWDGKFGGQPADPGTYIWILHYTNTDTQKYVEQKGTTILIR